MASRQLYDEISDQFLLCTICCSTFKNPKTLNCLHVFCITCLEKQLEAEEKRTNYRYIRYSRSITCSICRKRTEVPTGGLRRLPDNHLLSNLTEVINRSRPGSSPTCEICVRHRKNPREATSKCLECVKFMCRQCVELHKDTKVTKNHNIFDIQVEKDIGCKEHEDESVRFYCQPCESCICVVCTFQDHHDHEIMPLKDGINKHIGGLELKVQACKNKIAEVKGKLEAMSNAEHNMKNIETRVNDIATNFMSSIRTRQREILDELRVFYGSEVLEELDNKDELEQVLQNLQSTCSIAEIVVKNKSIDLLLLRKEIEDKINSLVSLELPELPENMAIDLDFVHGDISFGHLQNMKDKCDEVKHEKITIKNDKDLTADPPILTDKEINTDKPVVSDRFSWTDVAEMNNSYTNTENNSLVDQAVNTEPKTFVDQSVFCDIKLPSLAHATSTGDLESELISNYVEWMNSDDKNSDFSSQLSPTENLISILPRSQSEFFHYSSLGRHKRMVDAGTMVPDIKITESTVEIELIDVQISENSTCTESIQTKHGETMTMAIDNTESATSTTDIIVVDKSINTILKFSDAETSIDEVHLNTCSVGTETCNLVEPQIMDTQPLRNLGVNKKDKTFSDVVTLTDVTSQRLLLSDKNAYQTSKTSIRDGKTIIKDKNLCSSQVSTDISKQGSPEVKILHSEHSYETKPNTSSDKSGAAELVKQSLNAQLLDIGCGDSVVTVDCSPAQTDCTGIAEFITDVVQQLEKKASNVDIGLLISVLNKVGKEGDIKSTIDELQHNNSQKTEKNKNKVGKERGKCKNKENVDTKVPKDSKKPPKGEKVIQQVHNEKKGQKGTNVKVKSSEVPPKRRNSQVKIDKFEQIAIKEAEQSRRSRSDSKGEIKLPLPRSNSQERKYYIAKPAGHGIRILSEEQKLQDMQKKTPDVKSKGIAVAARKETNNTRTCEPVQDMQNSNDLAKENDTDKERPESVNPIQFCEGMESVPKANEIEIEETNIGESGSRCKTCDEELDIDHKRHESENPVSICKMVESVPKENETKDLIEETNLGESETKCETCDEELYINQKSPESENPVLLSEKKESVPKANENITEDLIEETNLEEGETRCKTPDEELDMIQDYENVNVIVKTNELITEAVTAETYLGEGEIRSKTPDEELIPFNNDGETKLIAEHIVNKAILAAIKIYIASLIIAKEVKSKTDEENSSENYAIQVIDVKKISTKSSEETTPTDILHDDDENDVPKIIGQQILTDINKVMTTYEMSEGEYVTLVDVKSSLTEKQIMYELKEMTKTEDLVTKETKQLCHQPKLKPEAELSDLYSEPHKIHPLTDIPHETESNSALGSPVNQESGLYEEIKGQLPQLSTTQLSEDAPPVPERGQKATPSPPPIPKRKSSKGKMKKRMEQAMQVWVDYNTNYKGEIEQSSHDFDIELIHAMAAQMYNERPSLRRQHAVDNVTPRNTPERQITDQFSESKEVASSTSIKCEKGEILTLPIEKAEILDSASVENNKRNSFSEHQERTVVISRPLLPTFACQHPSTYNDIEQDKEGKVLTLLDAYHRRISSTKRPDDNENIESNRNSVTERSESSLKTFYRVQKMNHIDTNDPENSNNIYDIDALNRIYTSRESTSVERTENVLTSSYELLPIINSNKSEETHLNRKELADSIKENNVTDLPEIDKNNKGLGKKISKYFLKLHTRSKNRGKTKPSSSENSADEEFEEMVKKPKKRSGKILARRKKPDLKELLSLDDDQTPVSNPPNSPRVTQTRQCIEVRNDLKDKANDEPRQAEDSFDKQGLKPPLSKVRSGGSLREKSQSLTEERKFRNKPRRFKTINVPSLELESFNRSTTSLDSIGRNSTKSLNINSERVNKLASLTRQLQKRADSASRVFGCVHSDTED